MLKRKQGDDRLSNPSKGTKIQYLGGVSRAFFKGYVTETGCGCCSRSMNLHLSSIKRHFEAYHMPEVQTILANFDRSIAPGQQVLSFGTTATMTTLMRLFLSSPVPMCLIRNKYFRDLLSKINGFKPPGERKLKSMLCGYVDRQIEKVVQTIREEELYYAVCIDTASMPNTKLQFLGVVIHYYDSNKNRMTSAGVDLLPCKSTTGEQMRNAVTQCLTKLNLPPEKLIKFVADGASSMLKGFRDRLVFGSTVVADASTPVVIDIDDEEFADDEEVDPVVTVEPGYESDEDDESDVDESTQNEPDQMEALDVVDFENLSTEDRERYSRTLMDDELDDESQDFDDFDDYSNNYLHCIAHRIQLMLKDVFEKDNIAVKLRKAAFKLLASFSKSPKAVAKLRERAKLSLLFPATTRWGVLELVYSRMLKIKDHLNLICVEHGFTVLLPADYAAMKMVVELLTPVKQYLIVLQSETVPTLPLVLTGLLSLLTIVAKRGDKASTEAPVVVSITRRPKEQLDVKKLAAAMQERIRARFSDILSPENVSTNPTFLASSALDPTVAKYILKHGISLDAVRSALARCAEQFKISHTILHPAPPTKPTKKKAKVAASPLGFFDDDDLSTALPSSSTVPATSNIDDEIEKFIRLLRNGDWNDEKAMSFWAKTKEFPSLKQLFFAISAIPATSASVERLFSHLASFKDKKRSRMKPKTIRTRTLGSFNQKLG